jgi:hypothetical protein
MLRWEGRSEVGSRRAFLRMVNRRLLDEAVAARGWDEVAPFFCECGAPGCTSWVRLTAGALRSWLDEVDSSVVVPGHESEHDEVILRTGAYLVVFESLFGASPSSVGKT